MRPSEYKDAPKVPIVVVLDNVRSAHNVGSAFRTCDAFRIEQLILTGITPHPPHKDLFKTALGSTESVEWEYVPNIMTAIDQLKESGYTVFVVEQTEKSVDLGSAELDPAEKVALVFGNEVDGVNQEVVDTALASIEIPQYGTKHSFNVSVSIGIVLWEFCRDYSQR